MHTELLCPAAALQVSMPLLRPTPMHQQQQQHSSSSAAAADPGGHMHQTQHHQQQVVPSFLQSQQMQLSAPQDNYLSSRAVALRNVEVSEGVCQGNPWKQFMSLHCCVFDIPQMGNSSHGFPK